MKNLNTLLRFFILSLFSICILNACSRNPVTGKREFMLMSKKGERRLGEQSDPGIVASFGLYEDQKLQSFIDRKGKQMVKISHRPTLDFQFKIVDSPVVNAFAVPGGFVYFTRGIMAHFNNEAEFAGVLGHEIGHVTARHSAKQYSKSILAQIGFTLGVIFSPEFRAYSDVAQQSMSLLFLKFGRDHESQSDELGVEYSTKIGYDAKEMANFFSTLERMHSNQEGERIPDFLSTHPNPVDRQNQVELLAKTWQSKGDTKSLKINRDQYLRMIDGLVYGDDPKQGYVKNNVFYHPVLKFKFNLPTNWQYQNSPVQLQMAPKDGKALMVLSLGHGKSLNEASQAAIEADKIKIVNSNDLSVNGFPAKSILGTLENGIKVLIYLIQYQGNIYKFSGLSAPEDFNRFVNQFEASMTSFEKLTDPNRIDVEPDRIKIETVKSNTTFEAAMKSFNMPTNKMEELSLINGMELKDPVDKGSLIKTIKKGKNND